MSFDNNELFVSIVRSFSEINTNDGGQVVKMLLLLYEEEYSTYIMMVQYTCRHLDAN